MTGPRFPSSRTALTRAARWRRSLPGLASRIAHGLANRLKLAQTPPRDGPHAFGRPVRTSVSGPAVQAPALLSRSRRAMPAPRDAFQRVYRHPRERGHLGRQEQLLLFGMHRRLLPLRCASSYLRPRVTTWSKRYDTSPYFSGKPRRNAGKALPMVYHDADPRRCPFTKQASAVLGTGLAHQTLEATSPPSALLKDQPPAAA